MTTNYTTVGLSKSLCANAPIRLVGQSTCIQIPLQFGRIFVYETLVERARREAILRMKDEARECGAGTVFNVKLETSSITKGKKNQTGCVEVYAYGTAVIAAAD